MITLGLTLVMLLTPALAAAVGSSESDVSPAASRFPKNKQNESPLAVNPLNPLNAITGANDEILEPDCTPASGGSSSCPFAPGVDLTGVYWTTDGGATWNKQVLRWSVQTKGFISSDGDPAITFGPKPDQNGRFIWSNGVRAYFASLAGSPSFGPNQEIIAVSHSDDGGATWSPPVTATTRDNPVDFNDKVAIWADANQGSPSFGHVYVSWTLFQGAGNFVRSSTFSPEPITFARSTDGGQTFERPQQLSPASNNGAVGGRQGSVIRSGPDGAVYVFWDGALFHQSAILGARSDDGGVSFTRPFLVSFKSDVPSPFPGASFRTNSFPLADVGQADGKIFITWADYNFVTGHGVAKMATSSDRGATWNQRKVADIPGRSAFYPAVAVKPDGSRVFVGFNAIDDKPFGTEPGAGVVLYDAYYVLSTDGGATFGSPVKISAMPSDPDASSTNGLRSQFLGDYNGASAGSTAAWFSWTDTRNGQPCKAVDGWRASGFTTTKPNIYDSCPSDFGNSDIFVAMLPW